MKAREDLELYFSAMPKHREIALRAVACLEADDYDGFDAELRKFNVTLMNNLEALRTVAHVCKKHGIHKTA